MLNLNVNKYSSTQVFEYEVPQLGPNGSTAYLKFTAKPGDGRNTTYKDLAEKAIRRASIKDKSRQLQFERRNDLQLDQIQKEKDTKESLEELYTAQYNECIVEWETNIVSDGEVIECNLNTFLELREHWYLPLRQAFDRLDHDLKNWEEDYSKATAEIEDEEVKNLLTS